MADKVDKETRSRIMSAIRSSETNLEKRVRKALSSEGFRYRKNVKRLAGCPDIAFISKKVVVFVDSCFWHGCKKHFRMPKTNKAYWKNKINRNKERDRLITKKYKNDNWVILRFWEHDFDDFDNVVKAIKKHIK